VVIIRLPARLALAAVVLAALGLAACGRKGGLDLPPGAALNEPPPANAAVVPRTAVVPPPSDTNTTTRSTIAVGAQAPSTQNGFDASGNPVAPPGKKRPFILDPLLN
jgi:predicted small lipoprotein YifL